MARTGPRASDFVQTAADWMMAWSDSDLNEANKLRPQKITVSNSIDYSEQFYTDLRWSMSAWLLQQRFDTHDKTSLGVPIAGWAG